MSHSVPLLPHAQNSHALSGPRTLPTRRRIDTLDPTAFNTDLETPSDEPKYTSSHTSWTSLPDDQIPLLPEPPEQNDTSLPTLPDLRTYNNSLNTDLGLVPLFKDGWTHVTKVFRRRTQPPSKAPRRVRLDLSRTRPLIDRDTGKEYVDNRIRSNKYTPWTFIPRQLFAQFSKLANFYLLCFAILQLIPGLSTTGNYTNIIPLMIFVSISMAKEGFDDFRRHQADKRENWQQISVVDAAAPLAAGKLSWKLTRWRDLQVGDVVRLRRDELVPADIVLLSSTNTSGPDIAHVETTALDGETSLKQKQVVNSVADACSTSDNLLASSVEFVTEGPNSDLSAFQGTVIVNGQTSPLANNNIIYRGSILRNTTEVIAMILYTGAQCKILINTNANGHARIKAPRFQAMLNRIVIFVVGLVVALAIYNTLAYQAWKSNVESKLFYLSSAAVPLHQEIFGFIIMFATMVPLSLYVSMEMIKLAQIYFMNVDIEMYDARSDTPFESRTSTINEEMGQVTHVFSDKTGTLTNNEMKFRKLYVAGSEWTHDRVDASTRRQTPGSTSPTSTKALADHLLRDPNSASSERVKLLLLSMALCNSCIPETADAGSIVTFQASSPDELALVEAAQEMGFLLRSRDKDSTTLAITSSAGVAVRSESYQLLDVIDFSTERKRMSVILRFPDGRICIICKGADSVILERLKTPDTATCDTARLQKRSDSRGPDLEADQNEIEDCIQSVDNFARESLRTLLHAYRFIGQDEYAGWKDIWDAATTSLSDRQVMINRASELIETDLKLAGATAIEDKLQQGVPDAIDKLSRAKIKIWMLTGDKRETALNIGCSCGLINESSTISILRSEKGSCDLENMIRSSISTLRAAAHSVLVVDGRTLANISSDPTGNLEARFFDLIIMADTVICCRAQPSQKARLVSGIRQRVPHSVTLAVGDGANDIAMIQEAHIGIGITGKEGLQAARSSDYSIAQFRFLPKLLLVHGRWNYIRTCKYALGTLWKEVVFFLTQALFQRWTGFTGTSLYEPGSLSMFNTLFTTLPVLAIGIFEKDLPASTLLAVPELYRTMGQRNGAFNVWIYCGWTIMAVADSMIIFFCMLVLFGYADRTKDNTLYSMGDLSFVAVVIVVSIKLQIIETHDKSAVAFLSIFLSTGAAFLWNILLAATYPRMSPYKVRGEFFDGFGKNPTWWLTLSLAVILVCMFEGSVGVCRRRFFPTEADAFRGVRHQKVKQDHVDREQFGDAYNLRLREGTYLDLPADGSDMELQELGGLL